MQCFTSRDQSKKCDPTNSWQDTVEVTVNDTCLIFFTVTCFFLLTLPSSALLVLMCRVSKALILISVDTLSFLRHCQILRYLCREMDCCGQFRRSYQRLQMDSVFFVVSSCSIHSC